MRLPVQQTSSGPLNLRRGQTTYTKCILMPQVPSDCSTLVDVLSLHSC